MPFCGERVRERHDDAWAAVAGVRDGLRRDVGYVAAGPQPAARNQQPWLGRPAACTRRRLYTSLANSLGAVHSDAQCARWTSG